MIFRVKHRATVFFGLVVMLCSSFGVGFAQESSSEEVTVQVLKASLSKTETIALTLPRALEIAREQNPDIKAAQDRVQIAKSRYQAQLAQFLPDLEVIYYQANRNGAIQGFTNEVFDVDRETHRPEIVFRFPVFEGGRRVFQAQAAKKSLEAQRSEREFTLQQVLWQTALNYYQLKQRLEAIGIAQQQLEETQAQLALNRARLEAGAGIRLDVLQSEAQVARANQQLLEAVRLSQDAALRLNEILDLPAFAAIIPEEQGQQMQTLVPMGVDFGVLLKAAVQHRPELAVLARQIEATEALRKVVWSAFLPEISLETRLGAVGPTLGDLQDFNERAYSVNFLFRNLITSALARYQENTAQRDELRHRLESAANTVERQLSEAYLRALIKQAQIAAVRSEITASEQALSDAMERLRVGVGRNIDVLEAETGLTRARTNLSTTILEYNQAQVDLVYYLGLASVESFVQGVQLP